MRFLKHRNMYVPAFSILAVVVLLLILISVSTYRNLDRDKSTTLAFLRQQAMLLVSTLEAGARAVVSVPDQRPELLASLFRETAKNEDIAYLYLYDAAGRALLQADKSPAKRPGPRPASALRPPETGREILTRVRQRENAPPVFELVKALDCPPFTRYPICRPVAADAGKASTPPPEADRYIVVGLQMEAYEAARQADVHHAILMAGIVVALGSGAFFFLFVIQNFYLVDRTLKRTQDYTRQVVANMANGLISIDARGKIVSYNQLALDLLGIKTAEAKTLNLQNIIDFEASGIWKTLHHQEPVIDHEIELARPEGKTIPLSLSITPLPDEAGRSTGAVIILRDLREIKRLQERVRRNEKLAAIGKLSASVAHEIRNPLSSIRGFAQYLRHSLKNRPTEQEYAQIMVKEVDRINRVVNDLLTFARPLAPRLAPTDAGGLVAHTLRLVQGDARSRGVEIRNRVAPDLPPMLLDAHQLTQALLNLVLNALQSVDDGGAIEVGAAMADGGRKLAIWVEDNGPGIDPAFLRRIYDPFFTTREKGTGLGLAIVQKIVEVHGGEIRHACPSTGPRRGCRFVMEIPAPTAETPPLATPLTEGKAPEHDAAQDPDRRR